MHGPDLSLPITNPVMIFALVLLIILVLPLAFQRLRVPGMVGLIVAGVVIGPHALGILERDQTIELLGTVGLLYIMFIAGMEVDLNEFNKHRNRSIIFGSLTFILPQGIGALMGAYVLGFPWPAAILLGAVFASHTLLAYPIVSRFGLSKGPAVTTAVGATILTDTAALLVLAVIVRLHEGALSAGFWIQMIALLGLFIFGILWGVPRLGQWFFRRVRTTGVTEFVFVLAVVFVSAVLAEMIGVEAIIGAFLAGLALNRLVPEHSTLMNRTQFVGDALFIPFFLISVGMLVDVRILFSGLAAWIVAGSMLITLVATKWLAAMTTRPLFGYSSDQAWMMFGLTVPQAAATLATVLIGYNVGIFGDAVLNGTILMILITCIIGPWFAEKYGRRVALQLEHEAYEPGSAPERILVPLANPATAPSLMEFAIMARTPTSEQPIFPIAVVQNAIEPEAGVAEAEKLLGHAVVHGAAADVPVTPVVRIDRNAGHGIQRAVRELRISTLVMGWNGEGAARNLIFGSVLDHLLGESRELLLVTKIEQPLNTTDRVVLAVPPNADHEPGFDQSLVTVKSLAGQLSAKILIVSTEATSATTARHLQQIRPEVPIAQHVVGEWASLVSALDAVALPTDLLWLSSARQGSISWRPALNRLPRILARRFTDNTVVISYAPLANLHLERAAGAPGLATADLRALLAEGGVSADLEDDTPEVLFEHLLNDANVASAPHIARFLAQLDGDEAPELAPGAALYHAHARSVERAALYVGISRDGIRLPRTSGPVHVMMVLLTPRNESPDVHLRRLAMLAHVFRRPDVVERLREAVDEHDVVAAFQAAIGGEGTEPTLIPNVNE